MFLVFILLLFVCCQLCEQGCAVDQNLQAAVNNNENTIFDEFLKIDGGNNNKIKLDFRGEESSSEIAVKSIDSINLVAVNGVMVAPAQVIRDSDDKVNILAKFYEIKKDEDWGKNAVKKDGGSWKVQLAAKDVETKESETVVKSFAVVAEKEKKLYYFTFGNKIKKSQLAGPDDSIEWKIKLFEGEITAGSGTEKIKWTNSDIPVLLKNSQLQEKLNKQEADFLLSDSFAFVIGDKKYIAFVIEVKETVGSGSSNKYIIAVFELGESSGTKTLNLLPEISAVDCYPSLFQWEGNVFKRPTNYPDGCKGDVMVFGAKQENKFTKSNSSIVYLKGFLKDKKNFVSTIIERKNVLLFTQEKSQGGKGTKKNVYLWITDGIHVNFLETIVPNIEETFYGSLLYTDGELFVLHQKYDGNGANVDNAFSLTRLKTQLEQIKFFLEEWGKTNNTVLKLCQDTNEKNIYCTAPPPTEGLVGFLHNTINESTDPITWKDEFYYSNATVGKGDKVTNGFKFTGKGAGAKWPVGKQNESPVYRFTDFGLTLLATLKIEKHDSTSDNSLLGIGLNAEPKQVGLWCKGEKWILRVKEKTLAETEKKCEPGKEYNVAFVLEKDKAIKIYVNGDHLTGLSGNEKHIEDDDKITHFYFGVNNAEQVPQSTIESHVTVTNVLLYNKPFYGGDIINLKKYVKPVENIQTTSEIVKNAKEHNTANDSNQQQPTPPPGPIGEERKEDAKEPSPSRTEDGDVGSGVRVFSLLLAVLCVSAPLLHL